MKPTKHTDPIKRAESQLDFKPVFKVVPPIFHLSWSGIHEQGFMIKYFEKGFDGLIEAERIDLGKDLNLPQPIPRELLDRAAVYALTWHEFTYEAIRDFFNREDTRLKGPSDEQIRAWFDYSVEQIKALQVQHVELVPRHAQLKALLMMVREKTGVPVHEQSDLLTAVWYIKRMLQEQFPGLVRNLNSEDPCYVERPAQNAIGLRPTVIHVLMREYCEAYGYTTWPSVESMRTAARLAKKTRAPWMLEMDATIRLKDALHTCVRVYWLNRNWMIDHDLWMGGKSTKHLNPPGVVCREAEKGLPVPLSMRKRDVDMFG